MTEDCHDIITLAERCNISFETARGIKEAIKICKLSVGSQKKWLKERGITDNDNIHNAKARRKAIEKYINKHTKS